MSARSPDEQQILNAALIHHKKILYDKLVEIGDLRDHTRDIKSMAAPIFDQLAEELIALTNMRLRATPLPASSEGVAPELVTKIRGYVRDALISYKGKIMETQISGDHDTQIANIDHVISEYS